MMNTVIKIWPVDATQGSCGVWREKKRGMLCQEQLAHKTVMGIHNSMHASHSWLSNTLCFYMQDATQISSQLA